MEHTCPKCSAMVEDGVAFCPNCSAPQIRVSGLANRPVSPTLEPGTPGELQPPAVPVNYPQIGIPRRVEWAQAMPGAALAGFLLSLALIIPFASPFLLMIAAGGFAAAFYAHRSRTPISAGMGARVGAVGGLLGFVILSVMLALQIAIGGGHVLNLMRQAIGDQLARNPNPQAQEIIEKLMTPGGMAVIVTIGMLMFLAVALICSGVGGAIAGSLLGRRDRNSR